MFVKNCKIYLFVFLVFAMAFVGIRIECKAQFISQNVIASSGNYTLNGNTSLSYTIGEPIVQTFYSAKNTLTQGFQQPVDTLILSQDSSKNSISEVISETNFFINVYPNPFSNYINIQLSETSLHDNFTIELFNTIGQECITPILVEYSGGENIYKINTENLLMGIYVLRARSSLNNTTKSILLNRTSN